MSAEEREKRLEELEQRAAEASREAAKLLAEAAEIEDEAQARRDARERAFDEATVANYDAHAFEEDRAATMRQLREAIAEAPWLKAAVAARLAVHK